jgi:hypothetical protein
MGILNLQKIDADRILRNLAPTPHRLPSLSGFDPIHNLPVLTIGPGKNRIDMRLFRLTANRRSMSTSFKISPTTKNPTPTAT